MKVTKKDFIELTGENPEDVLGNDWENTVEEYLEENELLCSECGNTPNKGACFYCKQD